MTQPSLGTRLLDLMAPEPTAQLSLCDRLAAYFQARPNQWIDGMDLSRVAGCYAWRSRVSDLRKRGMVIQNREQRVRMAGEDGPPFVVSEYRYIPEVG